MRALEGPDCEIDFTPDPASCLQGRRDILERIDTPLTVFLDDDITVSPLWLSNLVAVMAGRGAAIVPMNLWSDVNAGENLGQKYHLSGVRRVEYGEVMKAPWLYVGEGDMCHGGATLYRTEALRATEYRPEYNGSFEDWDQILQITQDQGGTVWGSTVVGFHQHLDESRQADYWDYRWRWLEVLTAALAAWDRWGIRRGVRNTYRDLLAYGIDIPAQELKRINAAQPYTRQLPYRMPDRVLDAHHKQQGKLRC